MGTSIPKKSVEEGAKGAGPLHVTTLDRLDPKTREELIRKYNIKPKEDDEVKDAENTMVVAEHDKGLIREKYLRHKTEGLSDSEIRKMYGFKWPGDLTNWKKENGLDGYRGKAVTENVEVKATAPLEAEEISIKVEIPTQAEGPQENSSQSPTESKPRISSFRQAAIHLLTDGAAEVGSKEDAVKMVNLLEALELEWRISGKKGKCLVALIDQ